MAPLIPERASNKIKSRSPGLTDHMKALSPSQGVLPSGFFLEPHLCITVAGTARDFNPIPVTFDQIQYSGTA